MQGYLNRIWANYEVKRVIQVRKGVFLVRFGNLQDKMAVEKRGVYYFDSKPLLVKGWNLEMDLNTKAIKSLPLWVQFPNLDIKYWGFESLSKIGSIVSFPIKTNRYTKEKSMIKYTRLMEWREVQKHPSDGERQIHPDHQSIEHDHQSFTPVFKKSTAKQQQSQSTKGEKQITSIIVSATIYHTWSAQNHAIFSSNHMRPRQTVGQINEQVIHRILYLNTIPRNFIHCIDNILK
ncbi:hypothetical protein Cgig2_023116 [Carnegiea gigantea]|uniref:DUF4283 domain-containing protein n=1 Tax=Carnegiea gigantea TaxID=171969 RepID=A0A9Q1GPB0_9CARY|nr:hypothetical protein Cgig2_023116 [Carnegiea gigantea]